MAIRTLLFVSTVLAASLASAAGTGLTQPEKSREHPLDTREPRQDVIESRGDSQGKPRPPTLEAPPVVSPEEPSQPTGSESRPGENGQEPASAN